MIRRDNDSPIRQRSERPQFGLGRKVPTGSYAAEANNQLWLNLRNLFVEKVFTGHNLIRNRVSVSGWLMFYYVADVDVPARQPDLSQNAVKNRARFPNERSANPVFVVPRSLADEHDLSRNRPLAVDGLSRGSI